MRFPTQQPPTMDNSLTATSFGRHAAQSIAPFLSKHIPNQYGPIGVSTLNQKKDANSSTKYCYRHHPDLRCRRQANEPSMEQLQNELGNLPHADQQGIANSWSLFAAAPAKHRQLILQGILSQCCFPQLSQVSASVRDLLKIDFLTALPAELGLRILSYLPPTSICKAAQVSRRWRLLADDDVVWHRMCEQHIDRKCTKCGIGLPLLDQRRLRSERRAIQLRAQSMSHSLPNHAHHVHEDNTTATETPSSPRKRPSADPTPTPEPPAKRSRDSDNEEKSSNRRAQPWKAVYRERHRIGNNWKHGRYSVRTFKGHTNGVMCLQFDENIMATGSYDSTVKIWDIETGDEIRTLSGHALGVRCLQFDQRMLASGSLDGTVKVWDIETGRHLSTLNGHTGGVIGLHLCNTLIASGSVDSTIRVWNFRDKSSAVLRGHADWVNTVRIDATSRTLISGSDDNTVKLWDLDTRRCMRTLGPASGGHNGPVQQVVFMPPEFELPDDGEHGDAPAIPSTEDGAFRYPSPNSDAETDDAPSASPRPLPPRYMLSASLDLTIRLWDLRRGICVRTFFGHLEGVWSIAADTLRIVSGANDGLTKIWDPRTGRCERTLTGHAGPVTCVGLSDRRMATGSEDHEVRLYSFCA